MTQLSLSLEAVRTALVAAHESTIKVTPFKASGCGRVYVCIYGLDRKTMNAVKKVCKETGRLFVSQGLYIGYDNCDGIALARGEAFAKTLNEHGIKAYSNPVED